MTDVAYAVALSSVVGVVVAVTSFSWTSGFSILTCVRMMLGH